MSQSEPHLFVLHAIVLITVAGARVTGWLQLAYEFSVVRGAVLVPGWWIITLPTTDHQPPTTDD